MSPISALIVAYFALLIGMSIFALPYRRRMRDLGAELLASGLNERERRTVEGMLRSAYSWRGAIVLLFTFLAGLFVSGDRLDEECEACGEQLPNLLGNPTFHRLADAHFASLVGVNPIFGMFAVLAKFAFGLKARLHSNGKEAQRIADFRTVTATI